MNSFRCVPRLVLILVTLSLGPLGVVAQTFPDKPVRLIVPYPPGGGPDAVARTLSAAVAEDLGKPLVIEYKPGASSLIGVDAVAKSKPDGHTIGVVNMAFVANPTLMKSMPYDTERDLSPVTLMSTIPLVMTLHPGVTARSVADYIALAKSKPGGLLYGSAGNGTSNHLLTERFKVLTGTELVHVPYKGGAPSVLGLLGGETTMVLASPSSVIPHIRGGRLVAIAVGGAKRVDALPEVPTIGETVPGFQATDFAGVVAPAGTPGPVVDRLNAAFVRALANPEVASRLAASGAEPVASSPSEFNAFLKREIAVWGDVIRKAAITVD